MSVGYWEKEGAHHQGDLSREGEDMEEKTFWGPGRDKLGSAAAQLPETLKQSTSFAGTEGTGQDLFINCDIFTLSQSEFSLQERKKKSCI